MKLEQQITNLELSKKLKELGVRQESLFVYVPQSQPVSPGMFGTIPTDKYTLEKNIGKWKCEHYPAFTVAELGEMLPIEFDIDSYKEERSPEKGAPSKWCSSLERNNFQPRDYYTEADTEANARAKMLIYLLENKLLNPLTK